MFGAIFNTIGSVVGGVGKAAGSALSTVGSAAGGVGQAAWQLPGQVVKGVGGIIESLPKQAEAYKPVAEVLGSVYGAYTTYEQTKAAREAAKRAGSALGTASGTIPVTVPSSTAPSFSVNVASPPMTEDERLMREAMQQGGADTQKFMLYGAIALGAFVLLSKKRR